MKTGFDAFWYLRCGLTYRLLFFFWGGVTTHFSCTPGLQEIPFEFLMNFLWIFMIFFCIVLKRSLCKSYAFLMQFLCIFDAILMHFLCNFLCIFYAVLMRFLCSSYAVLKLHTLLPKLHTLLPKTYEVLKIA